MQPDMKSVAETFLLGAKEFTVSTHLNSYPIQGAASIFFVLDGSFFVKPISLADMRALGMTALVSYGQVIPAVKNITKSLAAVTKHDAVLVSGQSLYIPDGYVVFVAGLMDARLSKDPKERKKAQTETAIPIAAIQHVFDRQKFDALADDDKNEVELGIKAIINKNKESKSWKAMTPALNAWIGKA